MASGRLYDSILVRCRNVYTRRVTFIEAVKLRVVESRIIEGMEVEAWFGRCRVHRDEWYGIQILTQNQQSFFTHSASSDAKSNVPYDVLVMSSMCFTVTIFAPLLVDLIARDDKGFLPSSSSKFCLHTIQFL
jgi:hypothetical protein